MASGRGRPATRYRLDASAAMLLVADVGALGMRLARVDLEGRLEEASSVGVDIAVGPDELLGQVRKCFDELTASSAGRPLWGIGISLPGPVDHAAGRVISPPIMTGWHGFPVRETLQDWYGCPVLVENDVNAMAVGELIHLPTPTDEFLVVKVGTGVGCGIVSGGRVIRGAAGSAGDIGHTAADTTGVRTETVDCRCGKRGCVETYAGGWALARDLSDDRESRRLGQRRGRPARARRPHGLPDGQRRRPDPRREPGHRRLTAEPLRRGAQRPGRRGRRRPSPLQRPGADLRPRPPPRHPEPRHPRQLPLAGLRRARARAGGR